MSTRTVIRDAMTGPGALTRVAVGTALVATLAAQHPHPAFDRLRRKDLYSLLPNWKFFAPNPATHDFHYLYRTLDQQGETSEWTELDLINTRRMSQAFWFPTRRLEKAVFDICSSILGGLAKGEDPSGIPPFQLLREYIKKVIRNTGEVNEVRGFQFALVRASGHDKAEEPEVLFVSTYQPMSEGGSARLAPAA